MCEHKARTPPASSNKSKRQQNKSLRTSHPPLQRYRAVLMDQDVLHRLSPPSLAAGQPRHSLVWKLVLLPRQPGQQCCIARPEWGPPTAFGSSSRAEAVVRQLARKRKLEEAAGGGV